MDTQKPVCSYGVSCFRKNPFHFKQLSHPQFEKLLSKISGNDIVLPEKLEFECGNRALLQEQLEILRTIVQNESIEKSSPNGSGERKVNASENKSDLKRKKSTPETSNTSYTSYNEKRHKDDQQGTSNSKPAGSAKSSEDMSDEKRLRMREAVLRKMRECGSEPEYIAPIGDFGLKWILAAPYHMFFTAVPKTRATWTQSLSVTLSEVLDRSLGDIVQSLHMNMVVDFGWLVAQYMLAGQSHRPKMTVFYNQCTDDIELPDNIEAHVIKCPTNFGTHHCKVSIFQYQDFGIRIIVSSANLYRDDWEFRTQGLWISPHLPRMADSAKETEGESPTGFKRDFLRFLGEYDGRMDNWKTIVSRADCSSINVAFVASVPGNFEVDDTRWGHQKLGALLRNHAKVPESETRTAVIAQASSIGSLGPNYHSWIGTQIVAAMVKTQGQNKNVPDFKFIFPTIENFKNSHDMRELSNCLCNSQQKKQEWIVPYMHKWQAEKTSRTRAIPHIKTFTRISEDNKRIWWFVLGSANLSKAAWGQRYQAKYRILSYEAGVVFIPKFVTGEEDFSTCDDPTRSSPTFPMPYDLPLTPYSSTDRPFVDDFFRDNYQS
ncbi:probable tyrosyl-DNA phosphodiesterase isoform X2 [Venturia canescens]|uniref:probable tyrosyl-DNA phosphodiesterase isoform X2 n=1 Tax=Venturia canescens TaxID=32260 RepID=UPI001C9BE04D|nr:probable tyrosyl-DNA phosphodiesterase isoform X2 [Venturia canescens]